MKKFKHKISLGLIPRWAKKIIVLIVDCFFCFVATWLALCLRYEQLVFPVYLLVVTGTVSIILLVPLFIKFGLYRAIFRFNGWFAMASVLKPIAIYAFIYFLIFGFFGVDGVSKSIAFLQPLILFTFAICIRILAKWVLNRGTFSNPPGSSAIKNALIYGAGSAGRQIVSGLRQTKEINLVGFIDDNPNLWGCSINGLKVYAPADLDILLNSNKNITDIFLMIPSISRTRQKEILATLATYSVHVRILPSFSHLVNGLVKIEQFRDVEIGDVLGRDPVNADELLLRENVTNKVVLVTGAGGSIGSELCRQLVRLDPKTLILYELNEFALYTIERQLLKVNSSVVILPVLASVLDSDRLSKIIRNYGVQTVYHSAAYKHVPLIESNPSAGVLNNVFGTLRTLEASCKTEVETFVLISTDKAVRPTNIMGCTKRVAELILQAKDSTSRRLGRCPTKMTMVRFGNVLGSSGSVMPLFNEQIKSGGPVTVTHPCIIRYFMTIPEAAQLVIQAGALGKGGDVMVLDMGEPVKIVDLAKRMINLSGLSHKDESNPLGDIEIRFTGLRAGEKLYEELLIGDNTFSTSHSSILRAAEASLDWSVLEKLLHELEAAIVADDKDNIISVLKKVVPEFNPTSLNA